jgi:hypothetical protein
MHTILIVVGSWRHIHTLYPSCVRHHLLCILIYLFIFQVRIYFIETIKTINYVKGYTINHELTQKKIKTRGLKNPKFTIEKSFYHHSVNYSFGLQMPTL